MKIKFPPVFKISDYQNLFDNESKISHPNGLKKNKESEEMRNVRFEIIELLESSNCSLKRLEYLTVYYKQLYIINNIQYFLKIYTQVDTKSIKGNKYRTGSIRWPVINGKDVTVKISLGRISESEVEQIKGKVIINDFEIVTSFLISKKVLKLKEK
jgi:predicted DNA binding protein